MNANELIDRMKNKPVLGELDSKNVIRWGIRLAIDERDDIIAALSRCRIRNTATEPPTEEDGGTGNHAPYVMARENKHDFWEEIELEWVANHPDEYTQWTCVPEFEGGKA